MVLTSITDKHKRIEELRNAGLNTSESVYFPPCECVADWHTVRDKINELSQTHPEGGVPCVSVRTFHPTNELEKFECPHFRAKPTSFVKKELFNKRICFEFAMLVSAPIFNDKLVGVYNFAIERQGILIDTRWHSDGEPFKVVIEYIEGIPDVSVREIGKHPGTGHDDWLCIDVVEQAHDGVTPAAVRYLLETLGEAVYSFIGDPRKVKGVIFELSHHSYPVGLLKEPIVVWEHRPILHGVEE